jgi:hypothetical protein
MVSIAVSQFACSRKCVACAAMPAAESAINFQSPQDYGG